MIFELFLNPISFFIWLAALFIAITIHEFSHALVADYLGDPTPRLAGRLTLNPFAHLDPLGTLMLLIAKLGWGKPVPVDPYNLVNPRRDSALISLAGPASNLILATILSLVLHLSSIFNFPFLIFQFVSPIIILNVSLAIFNLLPFPPLDGSKILFGILPEELADEWQEIFQQYGLMILILLLFPFYRGRPLLVFIIFPIIRGILRILGIRY